MLVRQVDSELILITQADHAALAAQIMAEWRSDGLPNNPRRDQILEATRLHDIGWQQWDAEPTVDPSTGLPHDVTNVPLPIRQSAWPNAVQQLAALDKYVAALVAQHALTVYRHYQADPLWHNFFGEMARLRNELLDPAHLADFANDYNFVGMGDRWSLAFCWGWCAPVVMGIYTFENGQIHPDPFAGRAFTFDVCARKIPLRRYSSDADLRETLRSPLSCITIQSLRCNNSAQSL